VTARPNASPVGALAYTAEQVQDLRRRLAKAEAERDALRVFIDSRVWPMMDHAAIIFGDDDSLSDAQRETAEALAQVAMEAREALRACGGGK